MRKLKQNINYVVIFLLFLSCNQKNDTKEIDFKNFSMVLPVTWERITVQGIDSKVDIIVTQNKDSVYFDFGQYSQEFNETNKVFSLEQIRKYDSLKMDTKDLFFSDTPEIDQFQGTFLKEYYYYDTIDDRIAKIKIPKRVKDGEIGILFKNVKKEKLTIIGKNLDLDEQEILRKAFGSIKFK